MTPYLLAAGTALLVSLLMVPPTIRLARAFDLLDAPDAVRRLHRFAVPRVGGVAVWLGAVTGALAVLATQGTSWLGLSAADERLALGLLGGVAIMLTAGLVDDVRGLRPVHKLVAQLLAASVVVVAGFRLDQLALSAGLTLDVGWFGIPLAVLWIVGVTNAFNLVDGLDGLAGGVALVSLAGASAAGVLLGDYTVLAVATPIAAGIAGFLRHNLARPSRIFLGDVGSLSIGLVLSVLTVEGGRRPAGDVLVVVPVFALAFPLLDTGIALLRRWLRGAPLMGADGRHVHHQLLALGLTHGRAVALICLFAGGMSVLGLSIAFAPPTLTLVFIVLGSAAWALFVIHGARWLHYHELQEAQASFASGVLKARRAIRDRIRARELEFQIRQCTSFEQVERLLEQSAGQFDLEGMALCDARDTLIGADADLAAPLLRGRLLRLESALACGGPANRLVLRLWWRKDPSRPPANTERVITVLTPALEERLAVLLADQPRVVRTETPILSTRRARSRAGAASGGR